MCMIQFRMPGIETEQLTFVTAISKTVSDGETDSGNGGRWYYPGFGGDHDGCCGRSGPAAPDLADRVGRSWANADRLAFDGGDVEGLRPSNDPR